MNHIVQLYQVHLRIGISTYLQYRGSLLIQLIRVVLLPVVYLAAWTAVAQSKGMVGQFSTSDLATYYILLMVVNHFTLCWSLWVYEARIRMGTLTQVLLRPVHPIHEDIARNISFKILTSVVILPTAIGLFWAFNSSFYPQLKFALLFIPSVVLAFFLRFFLEWWIGMTAFWTTRVKGVTQTYYILLFFLSGQAGPLDLLPYWVQVIAKNSPFYLTLGFPVELMMGRLQAFEIIRGFVLQEVWITTFLLLSTLSWRAGLRRYSAVGS
jgi:ABC-2 type transport system permease protein